MNTLRLAALIVIATLLASCMASSPVRPMAPIYNGPVSEDALRGRIAFSGLSGLSAEIRADLLRDGEKAGSFKGALVMRPPDDMRVVLYNTFGTTVIDILRTGDSIKAYVPSERKLYVGAAASFLPPAGSEFRLEGPAEDALYYLYALQDGHAVREYAFDARSVLNSRATIIQQGNAFMWAEFEGYEGTVPMRIKMFYGSLGLDIDLVEPELDAEVREKYFKLKLPAGVDVLPMEAIGSGL